MYENDHLITVGFHYVSELGHEFKAESKTTYIPEFGETELSMIGGCLNAFLRQIGFYRRNDWMLMEDLTEEEYDALTDYLQELRHERGE